MNHSTVDTAMRLAFAKATKDVPVKDRTATYAMVRSAMNRRVGTKRPRTGFSVGHAKR